jgi:hypothetical protein
MKKFLLGMLSFPREKIFVAHINNCDAGPVDEKVIAEAYRTTKALVDKYT